ncbi:MAG TPA: excinuclease ABC subunit UvrC [Myxococcales bacterium LLY-WYZ-16_1]|nr:excinuclease ABC subunit UvrC [Myxococcales bacterium LLY-WYZ-16_1]
MARTDWLDRTRDLPNQPGVYLMRDGAGDVIYVGKAKLLRNRVRSYFQEGTSDYRAFVRLLGDLLDDIETIVTRSEKEALLLERELIRRHEPRFNVIWRDDKQYLMLRVDPSAEWPWVQVVRNPKDDGAKYFGPFHSASAARQTLRVVNRHFQLRTCRDSVLYHRKRPCLEYQIGRCPAPCCLSVDREEYQRSVDDVLLFLAGDSKELSRRLEHRMWEAAEREDFEVAAHYRDQLRAVNKTLEKQQVAFRRLVDQDAIGVYREGLGVCVAVVEVRGGRVRNVSSQMFDGITENDAEVVESFLLQRYASRTSPPREILVPFDLETAEALAELIGEGSSERVQVVHPRRGDKAALVEMAVENAGHGFQEHRSKTGAMERTLESLKEQLGLSNVPERIECYDISNLGPHLMVGSQVRFERGQPAKAKYRHYRIKEANGQNDFASMQEVMFRRLRRGLQDGDLPDLILIDGGKGQLHAARSAFDELEVRGIDLASLAKSRVRGLNEEDATLRSPERVFRPGRSEPVVLDPSSPELLLLAQIRDEAHRFAITFHKELRRRARTRSSLEDVPGIGPKRRRALLRHLGSLRRIREASVDALSEVPGMSRRAAEQLYAALHPGATVPSERADNETQLSDSSRDSPTELVDSLSGKT